MGLETTRHVKRDAESTINGKHHTKSGTGLDKLSMFRNHNYIYNRVGAVAQPQNQMRKMKIYNTNEFGRLFQNANDVS